MYQSNNKYKLIHVGSEYQGQTQQGYDIFYDNVHYPYPETHYVDDTLSRRIHVNLDRERKLLRYQTPFSFDRPRMPLMRELHFPSPALPPRPFPPPRHFTPRMSHYSSSHRPYTGTIRPRHEPYYRSHPRRRHHLDDIFLANHDDEEGDNRKEDQRPRNSHPRPFSVLVDIRPETKSNKSDQTPFNEGDSEQKNGEKTINVNNKKLKSNIKNKLTESHDSKGVNCNSDKKIKHCVAGNKLSKNQNSYGSSMGEASKSDAPLVSKEITGKSPVIKKDNNSTLNLRKIAYVPEKKKVKKNGEKKHNIHQPCNSEIVSHGAQSDLRTNILSKTNKNNIQTETNQNDKIISDMRKKRTSAVSNNLKVPYPRITHRISKCDTVSGDQAKTTAIVDGVSFNKRTGLESKPFGGKPGVSPRIPKKSVEVRSRNGGKISTVNKVNTAKNKNEIEHKDKESLKLKNKRQTVRCEQKGKTLKNCDNKSNTNNKNQLSEKFSESSEKTSTTIKCTDADSDIVNELEKLLNVSLPSTQENELLTSSVICVEKYKKNKPNCFDKNCNLEPKGNITPNSNPLFAQNKTKGTRWSLPKNSLFHTTTSKVNLGDSFSSQKKSNELQQAQKSTHSKIGKSCLSAKQIMSNVTDAKLSRDIQVIEPELTTIVVDDEPDGKMTTEQSKKLDASEISRSSLEIIKIESPDRDAETWRSGSNSPTNIEVATALSLQTQQCGDFGNLDTRMTYLYSFKRYFDDPRTLDMELSNTPSPSKNADESALSEEQKESDRVLRDMEAMYYDITTSTTNESNDSIDKSSKAKNYVLNKSDGSKKSEQSSLEPRMTTTSTRETNSISPNKINSDDSKQTKPPLNSEVVAKLDNDLLAKQIGSDMGNVVREHIDNSDLNGTENMLISNISKEMSEKVKTSHIEITQLNEKSKKTRENNYSTSIFQVDDLPSIDITNLLKQCKQILDSSKETRTSLRKYRSKSVTQATGFETTSIPIRKTKSLNNISSSNIKFQPEDLLTLLEHDSKSNTRDNTDLIVTQKQHKCDKSNIVRYLNTSDSMDYKDELLSLLSSGKNDEIDLQSFREEPIKISTECNRIITSDKNENGGTDVVANIVADINDKNGNTKDTIPEPKRKRVRQLDSSDEESISSKKLAIEHEKFPEQIGKRKRKRSTSRYRKNKVIKMPEKNKSSGSICGSNQRELVTVSNVMLTDRDTQLEVQNHDCSSNNSTEMQIKCTEKDEYITKAEYIKTFGRIKSPVNVTLCVEPQRKSLNIKQRRATFTCESDKETFLKKSDNGKIRAKCKLLFGNCSEDEDELITSAERNDTSQYNATKQPRKKRKQNQPQLEAHIEGTDVSLDEMDQVVNSSAKANPKKVNNHRKSRSIEKNSNCIQDLEMSNKSISKLERRRNSNEKRIGKETGAKVLDLNERRESSSSTDSRSRERKHKMHQHEKAKTQEIEEDPGLYSISLTERSKGTQKKKKTEKQLSVEDTPTKADNTRKSQSCGKKKINNLPDAHRPRRKIDTNDIIKQKTEVSKPAKKSSVKNSSKPNQQLSRTASCILNSISIDKITSQIQNIDLPKSSSTEVKKLMDICRRKSAPDIFSNSYERLLIDKDISFPMVCRAPENDINNELIESCKSFSLIMPTLERITRIETEENECGDTVHTDDSPDIKNDSIVVKQSLARDDDDVIEITPSIPTIDLTEDDGSPQKTLADLLLETKKEIQEIAAEEGLITLYRSDESTCDPENVEVLSASVSLESLTNNAFNLKEKSVPVTNTTIVPGEVATLQTPNIQEIGTNCAVLQETISSSDNSTVTDNNQTVVSPLVELVQERPKQSSTQTQLIVNNKVGSQDINSAYNASSTNEIPPNADVSQIGNNSHVQKIFPSDGKTQQCDGQDGLGCGPVPAPAQVPTLVKLIEHPPQHNSHPAPSVCTSIGQQLDRIPQTNSDSAMPSVIRTNENFELSIIDLRLIVEIFTRHAYFLAHLWNAQKTYVESLNQRPYFKHYFKAEIELFEEQKKNRLFSQSVRLWTELQILNIRASRNLSQAVSLIVEHMTVNLANKDMPIGVTKSMMYLLLGELIKPQIEMFATVPLLKTLIRHCGFVTDKMHSRSSGPFTEEMRRTLAVQVEEYNRLCRQPSLPQPAKNQSNSQSSMLTGNRLNEDVYSRFNLANSNLVPPNKPGSTHTLNANHHGPQQQQVICRNNGNVSVSRVLGSTLTNMPRKNMDKHNPLDNAVVQGRVNNTNQNASIITSMDPPRHNVPIRHQQPFNLRNFRFGRNSQHVTTSDHTKGQAHQSRSMPILNCNTGNQPQYLITRSGPSSSVLRSGVSSQPTWLNIQTALPGGPNTDRLGGTPRYLTNYEVPTHNFHYTSFPLRNTQNVNSNQTLNSAVRTLPTPENMQALANSGYEAVAPRNRISPKVSQTHNLVQYSNSLTNTLQLDARLGSSQPNTACQSPKYQRDNVTGFITTSQSNSSSAMEIPCVDSRTRNESLLEELLSSSENASAFAKPAHPVNDNFRIKLPFTKPVTTPKTTITTSSVQSLRSMTLQQIDVAITNSVPRLPSMPVVSSEGQTANISSVTEQAPSITQIQTPPTTSTINSTALLTEASTSKRVTNANLPNLNKETSPLIGLNNQPMPLLETNCQDQVILVNNSAASSRYTVDQSQTSTILNKGLAALSSIGKPSAMIQSQTRQDQPAFKLVESSSTAENTDNPIIFLTSPGISTLPKLPMTSRENLPNKPDIGKNMKPTFKVVSRKPYRTAKARRVRASSTNCTTVKEAETVEISGDEGLHLEPEIKDLGTDDIADLDNIENIVSRTDENTTSVPQEDLGDQKPTEEFDSSKQLDQKCPSKEASPSKNPFLSLDASISSLSHPLSRSHSENIPTSEVSSIIQTSTSNSCDILAPNTIGEEDDIETIDLTWIDDMDDTELQVEMDFVFVKQETVKNEETDEQNNMVYFQAPSPADSGIASPPVQNEEDISYTVVRVNRSLCICGQTAEYNCACGDACYCGQKCQLIDWDSHQKVCHIPAETADAETEVALHQADDVQPKNPTTGCD